MNATQVYAMLKKKIDSGPFGSPLVAASVAGMTDHDRVYVYTGDETGYTSGNWYYWDGTAWTSGGVYNATAVETDTTLTQSGEAADAKATGDAIDEVKSDLFNSLYNANIIPLVDWESGNISVTGEDYAYTGYFRTTEFITVIDPNFSITVGGNAVFVFEYDSDKNFISRAQSTGGIKYTSDSVHECLSNTTYVKFLIRKEPLDQTVESSIIYNSSIIGNFSQSIRIAYDEKDINNIKTGLRPVSYPLALGDDMVNNGYINATNGTSSSTNEWRYSDYIDVSGIKRIVTTMATFVSSNTGGLAFYDSSKTYISGVAGRATGSASYETVIVDVPSSAKYVRLSFRNSNISAFFAKSDEIYCIEKDLKVLNTNFFGLQLFEKIGVIGDSISVGWAKDKNGNNSRRNTSISWVQQMARRLGCTAYNLGASGVDPIEWFQSDYEFAEYCYEQYQSVGFCDLYIVTLGLNECTLGSISDINQSDYTQNGSTFYGQYARIIQMINAEHSDAIVMCLTEPTTRISTYDTAVRNICALNYINAELVDLDANYRALFTTAEIEAEKQPDGLHYTPYGYSLIADAMVKALNDYISKNSTHFKYVGVTDVT